MQSCTECFVAVARWQQWASKGLTWILQNAVKVGNPSYMDHGI